MRRVICVLVLAAVACGGPSTPADYVAKYGGDAGQYEAILNRTDCQGLGRLASDMSDRFNRASESQETREMALGFETAAVDRMEELDCP